MGEAVLLSGLKANTVAITEEKCVCASCDLHLACRSPASVLQITMEQTYSGHRYLTYHPMGQTYTDHLT